MKDWEEWMQCLLYKEIKKQTSFLWNNNKTYKKKRMR